MVSIDDHRRYSGLQGNTHKTVKRSVNEYVKGMAHHTNDTESVWAVLKRGDRGAYHHFTVMHLQRCADEFAFRLNKGNVSRHTMGRIASLCDKVVGKRLTYRRLTA